MKKMEVIEQILNANDQIARENQTLLKKYHILAVNLMASPGAGKTSLILQTANALARRLRLGVIEGDVASRIDADKVAAADIPVIQINTGGECHLDALTVQKAIKALPLADIDILFIENVGNLICPVEFRLGEEVRVVVASVPEGDDKPYKYPGIFTAVHAVVLNKMDLTPYVDFNLEAMRQGIRKLNQKAEVFEIRAGPEKAFRPGDCGLNPNGSGRKKKSDEGLFHSFHLFRKIRREIKMCLAIPVLLQKIEDTMGIVEIGGVTCRISLVLTPEAKEGNYVLIHAGYAIGLLDEEEARETLQLLTEMAAFAEEEDISKKGDPS